MLCYKFIFNVFTIAGAIFVAVPSKVCKVYQVYKICKALACWLVVFPAGSDLRGCSRSLPKTCKNSAKTGECMHNIFMKIKKSLRRASDVSDEHFCLRSLC